MANTTITNEELLAAALTTLLELFGKGKSEDNKKATEKTGDAEAKCGCKCKQEAERPVRLPPFPEDEVKEEDYEEIEEDEELEEKDYECFPDYLYDAVKGIAYSSRPGKARTKITFADDSEVEVKCAPNDTFDLSVGVALAICYSIFGSRSQFLKFIKAKDITVYNDSPLNKAHRKANGKYKEYLKSCEEGRKNLFKTLEMDVRAGYTNPNANVADVLAPIATKPKASLADELSQDTLDMINKADTVKGPIITAVQKKRSANKKK